MNIFRRQQELGKASAFTKAAIEELNSGENLAKAIDESTEDFLPYVSTILSLTALLIAAFR